MSSCRGIGKRHLGHCSNWSSFARPANLGEGFIEERSDFIVWRGCAFHRGHLCDVSGWPLLQRDPKTSWKDWRSRSPSWNPTTLYHRQSDGNIRTSVRVLLLQKRENWFVRFMNLEFVVLLAHSQYYIYSIHYNSNLCRRICIWFGPQLASFQCNLFFAIWWIAEDLQKYCDTLFWTLNSVVSTSWVM